MTSRHTFDREPRISCSLMVLIGSVFRMKDNADTLPLLTNPSLPQRFRRLPVVDVGANDGRDYTLPAALFGHRVYAFEPTARVYDKLLDRIARAGPNVSHVTQLEGFANAPRGSIYLRRGVAVSNRSGTAVFYQSSKAEGTANSLNGARALPRTLRRRVTQSNVTLTTLSDVLAPETRGVFLLKVDAQGHEWHILSGARAYIQANPVYFLLVEYYPKGLRAGGVDPMRLLSLLTHDLGYQCFDLRCRAKAASSALTLEEFVRKYPAVAANEFGTWTDLLCTRFDLL
jgi:FkbM family methyltransferase